jgi:hypothetical protein
MKEDQAAKALLLGRECRKCTHCYHIVPVKGKSVRQYMYGIGVQDADIPDDALYCGLYSDMSELGIARRRSIRVPKRQITPDQMGHKKIPPERTCRFWDGIKI